LNLDVNRPNGFLAEEERGPDGRVVRGAVVFLTNRRCPWRCLYCDLWKHTTPQPVPMGAIPAQIDYALAQFEADEPPPAGQIKLYNHGSFFDRGAIPPEDYPAIAARVRAFQRVVVESHPALIGERALRFRDLLSGQLEVAMGLETAHPEVLARLNKRMTLDQFARAAGFLTDHGIDVRAFILVQPPFLAEAEAIEWAVRSVAFAFACGVSVAVLIPTRGGTAELEALSARGEFTPPRLTTLEAAQEQGIRLARGRVFADTWDLERFASCRECLPARVWRMHEMNLLQDCLPPVPCACGGAGR
jgi:radical SAM enzyme (TIGR01210 family)